MSGSDVMARADRTPRPNIVLYNFRDSRSETQEQTAQALNELARRRGVASAITGNHVSRWERGLVRPSRLYAQLLSEHFGVPLSDLGLTRQRPVEAGRVPAATTLNSLIFDDPSDSEVDQRVTSSQQEWLNTRRALNARHLELAQTAAQLYPQHLRLADTGLISRPDWVWATPVDLGAVTVEYESDFPRPELSGAEDFTSHVRPLRRDGQRYRRYSQAVRDVAQPRLFENRYTWRLADVSLSPDGGVLRFSDMNYFDAMDTCEAIAHETALTHLANDDDLNLSTWRGLHYRREIGDPFDLTRRPVLMSINTLTVRADTGAASVVLHNRNAANVATSGGIVGVMPAGVFQPSSVRPGSRLADFDLWRNIMREYSEEFLGNPEHDGDGQHADYSAEPFRSLDAARLAGRLRVYCFGIALGALDLWAGLETVAVIDADVFDSIFADLVHVNDEGTVVRVGRNQPTVHVPFTRGTIDELWASGRLAPETAYSLNRAWHHREQLLSTV